MKLKLEDLQHEVQLQELNNSKPDFDRINFKNLNMFFVLFDVRNYMRMRSMFSNNIKEFFDIYFIWQRRRHGRD